MCTEEVSLAPKLQAALQVALDVPLGYLAAGSNLTLAALAGARRFAPYRHYPQQDLVDTVHRTRFFYHGHPATQAAHDEHGHFHLFVEHDAPGAAKDTPGFSHLVGLSLDSRGQPLRWFTTNRWVTGESWCAATRLQAMLPAIQWSSHGRLAPVARWLTAMVALFAADIALLLRQRDELLAQRAGQQALAILLEDRSL
ncbi:MAG: hypothetical protein ACEQSK_16435, partial [Sphingomonadaceae bacterium]